MVIPIVTPLLWSSNTPVGHSSAPVAKVGQLEDSKQPRAKHTVAFKPVSYRALLLLAVCHPIHISLPFQDAGEVTDSDWSQAVDSYHSYSYDSPVHALDVYRALGWFSPPFRPSILLIEFWSLTHTEVLALELCTTWCCFPP